MSKLCMLYHSIDIDGYMSAAIVKHFYNTQRYCSVCDRKLDSNSVGSTTCCGGITTLDNIDFIGYNYGDPIPDLSEYDKVIMCDISFPKDVMDSLKSKLRSNFVWIDHHISAINEMQYTNNRDSSYCSGLRDTNFAACELTWKYFFPDEPMPEIVRLVGRYDCFGHKGTNEENKVLEFQYGARSYITNYESAYEYLVSSITDYKVNIVIQTAGKDIYNYLCTEAKQTYKNGFSIYFEVTSNEKESEERGYKKYSCNVDRYKFICINKERFNPINFGIDYHKDGYDGCACFHYANGMWNFSLYNDNGKVDCSAIAKQYGGGGHRLASGFRVNNKDFSKIINNGRGN